MDLCSAIVYCEPAQFDALVVWLNDKGGVEVHQTDKQGKIIITVEDVQTTDEEKKFATETIAEIEKYQHVLSVMLVSQFSDVDEIA